MNASTQSGRNSDSILFVEDSRRDFNGVVEYLQEHGYCCARVENMRAGNVVAGEECLPAGMVGMIKNGFDVSRIDRQADLGGLKAVLVDIHLPDDSSQAFPIVAALRKLRDSTGANFCICVWSHVVEPEDVDANLPQFQAWGADYLVAKQYNGDRIDGRATGAKIRECIESP